MPKAGRSLFNWFQQSSNPIFQIPIVILSKKSITNLQLPPALSIMIMAVNETLKKTTFSPSFCMTVFQAQHSTTTNFTVPFFINASKQVFGCVIIKRNHLPPHPTPRLFCCEDDFILFRRVTEVTILFKFGVSSFLAQCTFEEILAAMQSRQTYQLLFVVVAAASFGLRNSNLESDENAAEVAALLEGQIQNQADFSRE